MRHWFLLLVAVLGIGYLCALGVTGLNIVSHATGQVQLSVEPLEALQLARGERVKLAVRGEGFTEDTRIFMHMNVNNSEADIANLPIDGGLFDMEQVDNIIYLAGRGAGIRKVDVSNPIKPRIVDRPFYFQTTVLDIERQADTLYLSCGRHGVYISEIGPGNKIGHQKILPTWGLSLASKVVGDFLYVTAGKDGLLVYNLKELGDSLPLNRVDTLGPVIDIAAYEDHLYLAAGKNGVLIYSLADPAVPSLVGKIDAKKLVKSITIAGESLYLLENGLIRQYQIEDPVAPQLLVEREHFSAPQRLFHAGDKVYVSDNNSGLAVIDNSSGVLSETSDFFNLGGDSRALIADGDYLYAAVTGIGLKVLQSDAIKPRTVAGFFPTPGNVKDFTIYGDYIYILDSVGQLQVKQLNVNPAGSREVVDSFLQTQAISLFFDRNGSTLYLPSRKTGVTALDISTPGQMSIVGEWPQLNADRLYADDEYLLAKKGIDGVELFKFDENGELKSIDQLNNIPTRSVLSHKDLIILSTPAEGIRFYRIIEDRLRLVSQIKMPFPMDHFSWALELAVNDNILYVANGENGLLLVDISDPSAPSITGTINLPGYTNGLWIDEDRIYVASRYSGVHTIDIVDPRKPRLLSTIRISDLSGRIERHNDLLYLANRFMGVLQVPLPYEIKGFSRVSEARLELEIPPPRYPGRYSLEISNGESTASLDGVLNYQ